MCYVTDLVRGLAVRLEEFEAVVARLQVLQTEVAALQAAVSAAEPRP
jgi:hypothetical protein